LEAQERVIRAQVSVSIELGGVIIHDHAVYQQLAAVAGYDSAGRRQHDQGRRVRGQVQRRFPAGTPACELVAGRVVEVYRRGTGIDADFPCLAVRAWREARLLMCDS